MTDAKRMQMLTIALYAVGAIFIVGIYAMMVCIWPAGWAGEPRQPESEQMIMGVYATLGVFLLRAAKDPVAHLSLIWFTIWSCLVHGAIMTVQATVDPMERANLLGDIPAIFLVAVVLWYLMPKAATD